MSAFILSHIDAVVVDDLTVREHKYSVAWRHYLGCEQSKLAMFCESILSFKSLLSSFRR